MYFDSIPTTCSTYRCIYVRICTPARANRKGRFCPCGVALPGKVDVSALIYGPRRDCIWSIGIEVFSFVVLYSFQDWGFINIVDINLDFIEIIILRVSPCPVDIGGSIALILQVSYTFWRHLIFRKIHRKRQVIDIICIKNLTFITYSIAIHIPTGLAESCAVRFCPEVAAQVWACDDVSAWLPGGVPSLSIWLFKPKVLGVIENVVVYLVVTGRGQPDACAVVLCDLISVVWCIVAGQRVVIGMGQGYAITIVWADIVVNQCIFSGWGQTDTFFNVRICCVANKFKLETV